MSRLRIAAIAVGVLVGVLAAYWLVIGRHEAALEVEPEEAAAA